LAQCRELLEECRKDPAWKSGNTVYTLVEDFVKPKTRGTGMGYALLRNQSRPLEVTVMVSHTWGENAEEFVRTLERSAEPSDSLFICAFSIYQCEDGAGPSIAQQLGSAAFESPFRRVLEHIKVRGQAAGWRWRWRHLLRMLPTFFFMAALLLFYLPMGLAGCIPSLRGCAVGSVMGHHDQHDPKTYFGAMCTFPRWVFHYHHMETGMEAFLPASMFMLAISISLWATKERWLGSFRGRMVAVPNRECDLYSRLWCVYEIFVATSLGVPVELAHTLAPAGHCRAREAVCGNQEDTERIRGEIEAPRAQALAEKPAVPQQLAASRSWSWSKRGYDSVDRAIRLTTLRAQRSMLVMMFRGIVTFGTLAVALPKGDWSTPSQLFGTVVCTGVQSISLVGVVFMSTVFCLARRARGLPSYRSLLLASACLVSGGMLFRTLDKNMLCIFPGGTNYPPFHHCFTFALITSGSSLAVVSTCARCFGERFIHWRWRSHVLALLTMATLVFCTLRSTTRLSAGQLYPTVVWYASFRVLPMCGFPAFLWLAAARWGVQLAEEGLIA